jgi:murein DD-endopeptidase
MNVRAARIGFLSWLGFAGYAFIFSNPRWTSQDIQTIPHLPLVYEVLFPPTAVKADGRLHLVYELHMTNFLKGPLSLRSVEVLGGGETVLKTYQGEQLAECLVCPGQPPDMKDKSVMEGGTRAVLFIMLSFKEGRRLPDALTHRITVEYARGNGEKAVRRGLGGQTPIQRKAPVLIGPPVRPGVWLAGNGTGDGPVGHRLSLQAWNGRLVVHQRYALDFMRFGADSRLAGEGRASNSHWPSYGQEVLAVADGVIAEIQDGIKENSPGAGYAVPNSLEQAAGNSIILGIGPGIYAVYAHLQPKSLRVKIGDNVKKGQVLGLIGNSGISDAPHLHFHVIDSDSVFGGEGLPFVFERFELMGAFEKIDDNLDQKWISKGKSSMRLKETPMGDVVIRFFLP